jgi:transcriptional regulator with XRE-family HTH domain
MSTVIQHPCARTEIHNRGVRTFGERLEKLRTDLNLSQEAVAQAIGKSQRAISALETTPGRLPSAKTLQALAAFFQVDAEWLVTGKGEQHPVSALTGEESELLLLFRAISPAGRAYILNRTQEMYRDEFERHPNRVKHDSPEKSQDGDTPRKAKRLN